MVKAQPVEIKARAAKSYLQMYLSPSSQIVKIDDITRADDVDELSRIMSAKGSTTMKQMRSIKSMSNLQT